MPAPSGIIAWWDGDAVQPPTAFDIADAGHDGTELGTASTTPGLVGNAFTFDGTSDIEVPNDVAFLPTTGFTAEAWVRPSNLQTLYARIVSLQTDGIASSTWILGVSTYGGVYFGLFKGQNQTWIEGQTLIPVNTWNHVAGTWDGATLSIYLNGTLQPQTASLTGPLNTCSQPVRIGRGDSMTYGFHGAIDEVTLYDHALTPSELAAIYAAGAAGKCK